MTARSHLVDPQLAERVGATLAPVEGVYKIALEGALTVVSGPSPPTPDGLRSDRLQILHWRVEQEFSDAAPHAHAASDEVYVVLEGSIEVVVAGQRITVSPAEALAVEAGVVHSLVKVDYPAHGLTIRAPAIPDKVSDRRSRGRS